MALSHIIARFNPFRRKTKLAKSPTLKRGGVPLNPRGWTIAYSPEFEAFSKKHPTLIRGFFKLIERNYQKLSQGKLTQLQTKEVKIETKYTGSVRGERNNLLLKLSSQGKELFLKVTEVYHFDGALFPQMFETTIEYLRKIGNKSNGFNIKAIKPHFVYFRRQKQNMRTFILSDFYESDEVTLALDLPQGKLKERINTTVKRIAGDLIKLGVADCDMHNVFYREKDNTLLLFDLRPENKE